MTENTKPITSITVQHDDLVYEITNMAGHTVGYLRNFLQEQGLNIPSDWRAAIFTMGPNETEPASILRRGMSILPKGMVDGKFQILQGEIIEVTDEYVLSTGDLILEFKIFSREKDA